MTNHSPLSVFMTTNPITCSADVGRMLEDDRTWFKAHPGRVYRLRPVGVADVPPGTVIAKGDKVLVRRLVETQEGPIRLRLMVNLNGRTMPNTDAAYAKLWRRAAKAHPRFAEANLRQFVDEIVGTFTALGRWSMPVNWSPANGEVQ